MSKTINFKAPDHMHLHKMTEKEITEMVTKEADAMLSNLPKDLVVSQVNSIKLQSNLRQVAASGVAVEWIRACCNRRNVIEDFTDPAIDELRVSDPAIEKVIFQNHFDSNLTVRHVTEAASLEKIKAAK
jgi:hypothetical protein